MPKSPSDEYMEKAAKLSKAETERLLSRSRNKLMRRLLDKKLTPVEAVAIQLEIEDEELAEWRASMAEIKEMEEKKKAKSGK
ncbi:MAG: hypothetical protein AB1593_12665 [Pseudomonadota bacterium]